MTLNRLRRDNCISLRKAFLLDRGDGSYVEMRIYGVVGTIGCETLMIESLTFVLGELDQSVGFTGEVCSLLGPEACGPSGLWLEELL
jgi:hypothetical protein